MYKVQCNPKVENFVFGNVKLAEHIHFIEQLHEDTAVELFNAGTCAHEGTMVAAEYLPRIVNNIMNKILSMYAEELERPEKKKNQLDLITQTL